MDVAAGNSWENTKEALKELEAILMCTKCRKIPMVFSRTTVCEHIYCGTCAEKLSECTECRIPVRPKEIIRDESIETLIAKYKAMINIVYKNHPAEIPDTPYEERKTPPTPRKQIKIKQVVGTVPKNINKPNHKGETRLHSACIKGNVELVKLLLKEGANPNTKDNSSWTPLQEAVCFGLEEIVQLLLEAGASPNIQGEKQRTALHEAVINQRINEIRMLLRYNANKHVCDKYGKKPIDYADSEPIRKLLEEDNEDNHIFEKSDLNSTLNQSIVFPNHTHSKIILFASRIKKSTRALLHKLAHKHKINVQKTLGENTTHVLVEKCVESPLVFTFDILYAIVSGKWLINTDWVQLGLETDEEFLYIDLNLFEVLSSATLSKINEEEQKPRLFNGCYFYFALKSNVVYQVGEVELTKEKLIRLVNVGGGQTLTREPKPQDITDEIIPFHVSNTPNHPLYRCTHYIIYDPNKNDHSCPKYNMKHFKALPLIWLIECIEKFTLIDPAMLGL